ncbi:MAG TPA: hypothetical protein VGN70_04935 [Gammaproteobacteria bacterium]|jgi:hypothetical protein
MARMVIRASLLSLAALCLCGCAVQRAEILGPDPLGYQDVSFLTPDQDQYFWIAPPVSGPHGVPPASMQLPATGVWVRQGWMVVEFQCFTPVDRPEVKDPILPETQDEKPVFIYAGHRYLLTCSPTRIGDFLLKDLGPANPGPQAGAVPAA